MKNVLVLTSSWLLCLIPLALISGPLLSDLFVSIIALIFLIISIKEKLWTYYRHPFFLFFITFTIYILIRSFFSEKPNLSLESSLFYFRFGIFSLAVWYLLETNKKLMDFFYFSILITIFFLIFDAYIQLIFDSNIFGFKKPTDSQGNFIQVLTGLFNKEPVLGSYLYKIFPLLCGLFFFHSIEKKKKFFFIFIILLTVVVFFSGSRSSIILHLLTIFFIFLLIDRWKKFFLSTFLMLLVVIGIIIGANEKIRIRSFYAPIYDSGLYQIKIFQDLITKNYHDNKNVKNKKTDDLDLFLLVEKSKKEKYLDEPYFNYSHWGFGKDKKYYLISPAYHGHFVVALLMFKDNIIFGQGTKMFRYLCAKNKFTVHYHVHVHGTKHAGCSTHPHNTHAQFLAETGLIGYSFLLLAFFYILSLFFNQIKSIIKKKTLPLNNFQICILSGFLITLWPFGTSGNFFNNWLSVIYYLPVGFYLYGLKNLKNK